MHKKFKIYDNFIALLSELTMKSGKYINEIKKKERNKQKDKTHEALLHKLHYI